MTGGGGRGFRAARARDADLQQPVGNWIKIACAALAGFVFLYLVIWKVPQGLAPEAVTDQKERFHQENEHRRVMVQIVGGSLILLGLYITWLRSKAMLLQAEVARDQQLTELYSRAIEQLGNQEHLEVRLGGIYALERIARESPKDHGPIMEVLTAFVRARAPRREEVAEDELSPDDPAMDLPNHPPADIQAALTVIGRREPPDANRKERPLDLRETYLRGADLAKPKLSGSD